MFLGSKAFDKLNAIMSDKKLTKNIGEMSGDAHTSYIEEFQPKWLASKDVMLFLSGLEVEVRIFAFVSFLFLKKNCALQHI